MEWVWIGKELLNGFAIVLDFVAFGNVDLWECHTMVFEVFPLVIFIELGIFVFVPFFGSLGKKRGYLIVLALDLIFDFNLFLLDGILVVWGGFVVGVVFVLGIKFFLFKIGFFHFWGKSWIWLSVFARKLISKAESAFKLIFDFDKSTQILYSFIFKFHYQFTLIPLIFFTFTEWINLIWYSFECSLDKVYDNTIF